jgi:hypothetical protein
MSPRARRASPGKPLQPAVRGDLATWRQRRLVRAGFDSALAASIAADRAIDVHALIELVERGCAPPLAERIVAPLDPEGEAC